MNVFVRHYERKPRAGNFSIERAFEAVRKRLPEDIQAIAHHSPFQSRGIVRRIINIMDAMAHQGAVNHIVGDVHYLALGLRKQRTILTIHDCVGLRFRRGMRRFVLLWFWYRLPIRRAAAVVAISRFTREEILQLSGCESGKVHVIPEAVTPDFHPCPKEFNAEKPVILQIGTSEHNKNLVRVAEALRGIPCQLHIIGRLTGTQCEVLKKNRIEYAEEWNLSDEQMVERYCQCDLVIFASTYEGFGMPIVEANATGRPVVTSNLCSMPEVADKAACLVDPLDSWSIRAGVLRIINEPQYRNQLIANGFENTKRFSADLIARKYAALYREVFSRSEHKSRVGS